MGDTAVAGRVGVTASGDSGSIGGDTSELVAAEWLTSATSLAAGVVVAVDGAAGNVDTAEAGNKSAPGAEKSIEFHGLPVASGVAPSLAAASTGSSGADAVA